MAKLSGVSVLPAGPVIMFGGITYVESAGHAVAGDIIRANAAVTDVNVGDYFRLVNGRFDHLCFVDNGGEDRQWGKYDNTSFCTVFTPAATQPSQPSKPATDIITHNGKSYGKTSRRAAKGETVLIIANHAQHGFKIGTTKVITDDNTSGGSDRTRERVQGDDIWNGWLDMNDYVVLTELPVAPTAAPASTLPADYVIHESTVYKKVGRSANVGEHVLIVAAQLAGGKYANGDVLTATKVREAAITGNTIDVGIFHREYVVLENAATVTLGDVEYTLESRLAKIGETVLMTAGNSIFNVGDIRVVHVNAIIESDGICHLDGYAGTYPNGKYVVLTPKAQTTVEPAPTSQPTYREIKRKANVGDRIKIVASWIPLGYVNGDEFTVKSVHDGGTDGYIKTVGDCLMLTREYVVLEPINNAPRPYQTGDIVKGIPSGDKYTLESRRPDRDGRHGLAWKYVGGDHCWIGESQFTLVTPAPEKQPVATPDATRPLSVGDYAKVTGGPNPNVKIGDIVKIRSIDSDGDFCVDDINGKPIDGFKNKRNVVRATDAEIAASTISPESAKWAAIGRKIGEIKSGDIVRVVSTNGTHSNGTIGIAEYGSGGDGRLVAVGRDGKTISQWSKKIELVAPVESLFAV